MRKIVRFIDESDLDEECPLPPVNWEDMEKEALHRERAQAVIDELYDGLPFPDFESTPEENAKIYESHIERLNLIVKNNLDANSLWHFAQLANEKGVSARAGMRAMVRHHRDPKQVAKQNVRECWERWQKNKHEYKSKSAFARAMLDKYESLESQRVIERWCKEWESVPY
ncbi:hypothetical protein PY257_10085 [Ramlibacter sp. H39-3-26]|uniref:hypothetical protein n=1 Tax=Curvibacter soli TaxID=3031331 RepID=UPI0023DB3361|nr:hypothetical protein [Ramlibacter sp. H39-3-26]MDF1485522.1 hypothetical protein [Ramlibacter sp. H39-3-26]